MDPGFASIIAALINSITSILSLALSKNDTNTREKPLNPQSNYQKTNTNIPVFNAYNEKNAYIDELNKYTDELNMYTDELERHAYELEKKLRKSRIVSAITLAISISIIIIYSIYLDNIFDTKNTDQPAANDNTETTTDITTNIANDNPHRAQVIEITSKISSIESATLKGNTMTIKIKKDDLFSDGRTKRGIILYSPQYNTPYNNEKVLVLKAEINEQGDILKTHVVIETVHADGYETYKTLDNYTSSAIRNDVCELAFDITNDYTDTDDIYIYNFLNYRY